MGGFRLSKWYLDCVAADGSAFIGYHARLRWGTLKIDYAAALIAPAQSDPFQISTTRSPEAPVRKDDRRTWTCGALGLKGEWSPAATPFQHVLLRRADGEIRWSCVQPSSMASIAVAPSKRSGAFEISGRGYVEKLELTIPPWRLPFDRLLWGRFVSADDSLVWIEWSNDSKKQPAGERRFVLLNGGRVASAAIANSGFAMTDARATLSMAEGRCLRSGHLAGTVFNAVPGLTRLLPASFMRAHESKQLSAAQLQLPDKPPADGWAIHEVVKW